MGKSTRSRSIRSKARVSRSKGKTSLSKRRASRPKGKTSLSIRRASRSKSHPRKSKRRSASRKSASKTRSSKSRSSKNKRGKRKMAKSKSKSRSRKTTKCLAGGIPPEYTKKINFLEFDGVNHYYRDPETGYIKEENYMNPKQDTSSEFYRGMLQAIKNNEIEELVLDNIFSNQLRLISNNLYDNKIPSIKTIRITSLMDDNTNQNFSNFGKILGNLIMNSSVETVDLFYIKKLYSDIYPGDRFHEQLVKEIFKLNQNTRRNRNNKNFKTLIVDSDALTDVQKDFFKKTWPHVTYFNTSNYDQYIKYHGFEFTLEENTMAPQKQPQFQDTIVTFQTDESTDDESTDDESTRKRPRFPDHYTDYDIKTILDDPTFTEIEQQLLKKRKQKN